MAIPVEEAIAALSTFSLEDEQPDMQGLAVLVSNERCATNSSIDYGDVSAYRLSLAEDTKAINQLHSLIQEGKEMASLLYTYRSCVKALPQLSESMKHSQADLYMETYQVLDLEMSRLREIQRWQASAASKFPIQCSLPWMLVEQVLESQDAGLLESILMPFDIYNDSAQHALIILKQRFLYDEIEAEVDLCFDELVYKLCEIIYTFYKCCAARYSVKPMTNEVQRDIQA